MPEPAPPNPVDAALELAIDLARDAGKRDLALCLAYLSRIAADEYLLKMVRRRLGQLRDGAVMTESGRN
jgi:hypothetical protein